MQEPRPLRIGEILDIAFRLYQGSWRVLIGAAAAVAVPLYVLTGVGLAAVASRGNEISGGLFISRNLSRTQADARFEVTAITAIVDLVITGFIVAASARAIGDIRHGREASIGGSIRPAVLSLASIILIEVLYVIGVGFGFVLLIIPGIWLYVAWSLAVPILIIEGRGPLSALARSRQLIRGGWWHAAGALLTANLMVGIAGELLTALLGGITLGSYPTVTAAVVVRTLTGIVAAVLLQPFAAIVYTVLFYDLRLRHDGEDPEGVAPGFEGPDARFA